MKKNKEFFFRKKSLVKFKSNNEILKKNLMLKETGKRKDMFEKEPS